MSSTAAHIRFFVLSTLATLTPCAGAFADHVSVTGPGGPIVDNPGPPAGGAWPGVLPPVSFVSAVASPSVITSVISVSLTAIAHTWVGDLQIVLVDPMGVGHNLMVRPGAVGTAGTNSGDFLAPGQSIVFIPAGGATIHAAGNIPTGAYDPYYGPPGDSWVDGALGIFNTPLGAISGPAGVWTLVIYDWALFDFGAIASWTISGWTVPGVPFCEPGAGGVMACVCGNPSGAGVGCANTGSPGADLTSAGVASLASDFVDPGTLTLTGSSMLSGSSCIFLQGNGLVAAGTTFGAGIRCAGGSLKRLYLKSLVGLGGTKTAPEPGDRSISNRSADLGDVIPSGAVRYYQTYYRDPTLPNPGGACPVVATFNLTTGQMITWSP